VKLLPPWARGPFELLVHAEGHLRNGGDFDRRIALISFDNAIEVAITTYLSLHPIQRGNRNYTKADVEKWLGNYHTKLDFLDMELSARGLAWEVDRSHIVWAHDHRNEQYHGGNKGTPEKQVLGLIRQAALWILSALYEVRDAEQQLEQALAASLAPKPPERNGAYDHAIDRQYGMVEVGDQAYYASEVLFAADYAAYREIGARLCGPTQRAGREGEDQPK
jgi:hypothetical protein